MLSKTDLIRVHRLLDREPVSLSRFIARIELNFSRMALCSALRRGDKFRHVKILRTPDLTTSHKQKIILFAVLHVEWELE